MPRRIEPHSAEIGTILSLIQTSFAYMDGRIDPPSSMLRLTKTAISEQAARGEVWVLGDPVVAVMFLTVKPGRLYLGKLAVKAACRGKGLARRLVNCAEARALALGLPVLELETRVELVENHAAFARMGFVKTGEKAHSGYDRSTSITMQKRLS
nr:GNAT family N-acetyltransferase [Ruegeria marina]